MSIKKRRATGNEATLPGGFKTTLMRVNPMTRVHNVFKYKIGGNNSSTDKGLIDHPAIMPEKLAEDQIMTWTNPGDTVFDPFSGSGTSGKMAIKHNREYIGVEINRDYCDVSRKRIESSNIELRDELFDFG